MSALDRVMHRKEGPLPPARELNRSPFRVANLEGT